MGGGEASGDVVCRADVAAVLGVAGEGREAGAEREVGLAGLGTCKGMHERVKTVR